MIKGNENDLIWAGVTITTLKANKSLAQKFLLSLHGHKFEIIVKSNSKDVVFI